MKINIEAEIDVDISDQGVMIYINNNTYGTAYSLTELTQRAVEYRKIINSNIVKIGRAHV